jgi:hypothetical protein
MLSKLQPDLTVSSMQRITEDAALHVTGALLEPASHVSRSLHVQQLGSFAKLKASSREPTAT